MRVLVLLAILALSAAINPIVIKGNKFFDSVTGLQFYVVGVDYAPSSSSPDPIADTTSLTRDIALFKDLGINTIRVYSTASVDHTAGLKLLADNNIYLILDVTDKTFSISNSAPSWDLGIFDQVKAKLTPFLGQAGVLGFLAGNEVVNQLNETTAAAFVKASIRDVKAYIKSQGYSTPVGYAATDVPANVPLQEYLDCISRETSVDFYGLNTYRWCGNVTYESTSYPELKTLFGNYHAPFIFTEYGCNQVNGSVIERPFTEVAAIYGSEMTSYLSGGLVYEWSEEQNNFGLVTISGGTVTTKNDYKNLKAQLSQINPTRALLNATADTTSTVDTCPTQSSSSFLTYTTGNVLPLTPDTASCACMFNTLSCVTSVTNITQASTISADIKTNSDYICGTGGIDCSPVNANSQTGAYGQYSACNSLQRASYVLNAYYTKNQAQGRSACDTGSFKSVQFIASPSNQCTVTTSSQAGATTSTTASVTGTRAATTSTTSAVNGGTSTTRTTSVVFNTSDARSIVPAIVTMIVICIMAL